MSTERPSAGEPGIRDRIRDARAPVSGALLERGFRPFFLLAALFGCLSMAWWTVFLTGSVGIATYYGALGWHAHEMLFGYTVAVLAGFLLTAVHNWTNAPTATGGELAALALLWLAGRLPAFFPGHLPPMFAAAVDLAFLPALAWSLGRPLLSSGQRRNLVFLVVLILMTLANFAVHGQHVGITGNTAAAGFRAQLSLVVMLMVLIAGRVIPFFTERTLSGSAPRRWTWVERAAIGSVVALAIAHTLFPFSTAVVLLAVFVAGVHAYRWLGWYSPRIWSKPLLWVLYLGYAWLIAGFVLTACAAAGLVAMSAAVHAFTAGGIGVLTLGMMTRVTLGHTGRALEPGGALTTAFVLVNAGALFRVILPVVLPPAYRWSVVLAGVLWCAALAIFVAVQGPMLWRARVDGKPG